VYNINPGKLGQVQNVDQNSTENTNVYNGYDASMNVRFGQGGNLLAGMSSGLTRLQTCQVADPNKLQYCDQTLYDIPWNKQFKLSGSYTIPYGIAVGAVVQSSPGQMRTINSVVTRAVVPTLTVSSVTAPLNAPGTLYLPRLNQLDLKFSKTIRYRTARIQPELGIFNVTNSNVVLLENNTFGPSLNNVQQILDGRFVRFGIQVDF
jgi:hypothetical protein